MLISAHRASLAPTPVWFGRQLRDAPTIQFSLLGVAYVGLCAGLSRAAVSPSCRRGFSPPSWGSLQPRLLSRFFADPPLVFSSGSPSGKPTSPLCCAVSFSFGHPFFSLALLLCSASACSCGHARRYHPFFRDSFCSSFVTAVPYCVAGASFFFALVCLLILPVWRARLSLRFPCSLCSYS